jgi:glucosamine-6-phosphate deaminase
MEVVIKPTAEQASRLAANLVAQLVRKKPNAVLGLATGSTPLPLYAELSRMHKEDDLNFRRATTFNLDEYIGLGSDHPCSYHYFMMENLFRHINVPKKNIHIPDGLTKDVPSFCQEYEAAIKRAGGIDLQILGLGWDGHIGFNEPTSSLSSRTRIKTLTKKTIEANKRFFSSEKEVPRHVITMGVGTIQEAKRCVLLAYGENKAAAVAAMVEGPITAMAPASVLQMHPSTVVIIDEAAAKNLKNAEYYRYVYDHKPSWQRYE